MKSKRIKNRDNRNIKELEKILYEKKKLNAQNLSTPLSNLELQIEAKWRGAMSTRTYGRVFNNAVHVGFFNLQSLRQAD